MIDEQTLLSIDPGYDATQAVAATLEIRGLRGDLSFDALVNTLRFTVPAAGVDVSFDGPTRDEALSNFEDWLKGEFASALAPKDVTTDLLQALVAESPVDPVAGNPNSLQSRMFEADFRMGTASGLSALRDGGIVPSPFRLDIAGGYYDADGFDVYALELPLHADRLGTGFGWQVFASDARFFGDELFLESYQKLGAAVAAGLPLGGLQLELAYLTGRRYQGVSAQLGLRF